jgi:hypothetical protein
MKNLYQDSNKLIALNSLLRSPGIMLVKLVSQSVMAGHLGCLRLAGGPGTPSRGTISHTCCLVPSFLPVFGDKISSRFYSTSSDGLNKKLEINSTSESLVFTEGQSVLLLPSLKPFL